MKLVRKIVCACLATVLCAMAAMPVFAAGVDTEYSILSGGMSHTLAVKNDGSVWAWGDNSSGQLGNEEEKSVTRAVKVEGLTASSVAAGYNFSAALLYDGTVSVWGNGSCEPQRIPGMTNITSIAAGQTTLLGLQYNGTVWKWEIGSTAATQVPDLWNIVAISAGGGHYLALASDGRVWSWGRNDLGQLGLGHTNTQNTPKMVPGLYDIVDIAAGYSHSLAVDFDGKVYSWGANTYGQLGDGTTTNQSEPVEVVNLKNVQQVSAGQECSMALTEEQKVYAWGYGEYGQIGNNSTNIQQTKPVSVTSSTMQVEQIASGLYHNLMVTTGGEVYAWGRNRDGQLGTGKNTNGTAPQRAVTLRVNSPFEVEKYAVKTLDSLNSWSKEEISALYEIEFLPPTLWCNYQNNMTRAEFAYLVVNIYEQVRNTTATPSKDTVFKDIKNHMMEEDILKAYQLKLLNGRSENSFAPDAGITRQEVAKLLCTLVSKLENVTIPTQGVSVSFYQDAAAIDLWAAPYVSYAYKQGIMQGTGNRFNPGSYITREQALLMVARLVEKYEWNS
ncbi:RCC1 domain-containing protein [Candidatus Avoscillospira sp. LCP25S3_F1]|uniref:RCC1 domain-containing protein n=1 Tax=Candidatus Avoscillospira sp. LCP25S3_F1 TaxID=3438825 RepID=UPI003F909D9B